MKKVIKALLVIVICFCVILGTKDVNAKEVAYTNEKGFEFTQDEYNFFKKVYGQKFVQKYLDQDIYNQFHDVDFANDEVVSKLYTTNESRQNPSKDSPFFSSSAKSILLSKHCTQAACRAYITVTWLGDPSIKSYDDIGVYLDGPSRMGSASTYAYSSTSSNFADATKYQTDGFGASILLPQTGDDIIISQSFIYTGTGTIYASYQHAMVNTVLTVAQSFNISAIGYGGVFDFYNNADLVYDNMNGVDLDV